jgi:hypothetical protein
MRFIAAGIITLALFPATSSAQSAHRSPASAFAVSPAPAPAASTGGSNGPTIEMAAVGVRPAPSKVDATQARARAARRSSGVGHAGALIVVGAGAMVAGSVIDGEAGTVFLVGGALIALYGLYLLVQ